jgi:two-component system phosphate regulon sensor histidine kinase PhoR
MRLGAVDDDLYVGADYRRLNQVFLNLLHNAVKFSPPGGFVAVQVEPGADRIGVSITNQCRNEELGFDDEDIFARFRTGRGDSRAAGGGFGLGLAIARGLVRAHGGDIVVRGFAGTICFRVELPRLPAGEPLGHGCAGGKSGKAGGC